MGYKGETFTRDFHLIRETLVFFLSKINWTFFLSFWGSWSVISPGRTLIWNSRGMLAEFGLVLVYSGRKAVVLLPIEISFGVVLKIQSFSCWAITQFIPHLWYISHKVLVTDDTMFSSVESSEGKATPRGAKFHFLRAFSSVAYEIHPRDSPPPFPSLKYLLACCKQQFDRASIPTADPRPRAYETLSLVFPVTSRLKMLRLCASGGKYLAYARLSDSIVGTY